jgi:hypothetical protein
MEKLILILIGGAAVFYLIRLAWKSAKGEVECSCAQGSCSKSPEENNKDCCGGHSKKD